MPIQPDDAQSSFPPGDEFWGDHDQWPDTAQRRGPRERAGIGSTIRGWWDTLVSGGSTATRTHGRATTTVPRDRDVAGHTATPHVEPQDVDQRYAAIPYVATQADATPYDRAALDVPQADFDHGDDDAAWDDGWDVERTPVRRSGVDPLLARFGVLAIVVTLSVPVVMGLTSGSDSDQLREAAAAPGDSTAAVVDSSATSPASTPATNSTPTPTPTPTTPVTDAPDGAVSNTVTADDGSESTQAEVPDAQLSSSALVAEPATTVDACGADYELAVGDYWIRIADEAGVRLSDLLAVNDATIETVLVPGRSICLPVGAATPSPPPAPTTAAPTNAPAPSSSASPPTTQAPAPTTTRPVPTTTTRPPTTVPAAPADVEAIIRSVWPDHLEDRALQIAWRESNYQPDAKNYCCYGVFQIYWSVHQSWLGGMGITSAEQLYDPMTNTRAAYALYERAGGFGPWGG